jgi:hypothetical protein
VPLTNRSGSGRPRNIRILWIRIRNTAFKPFVPDGTSKNVPKLQPAPCLLSHLIDVCRRLKLKNYLTPAKAKKGAAAAAVEVESPTHATVYVAKSYPPWQCVILDTLR